MVQKYLLDTCIWRDFYEARLNRQGSPWGTYAALLFEKILKEKAVILYSEVLIDELHKDYDLEEIEDMLAVAFANGNLVRIDITKDEYEEGMRISRKRNIPLADCINSIHSRNHSALLVSTDPHLLYNLKDIAKAVKPEMLI